MTSPQWLTVEVIFLALCRIADVDPDDYGYDQPPTHREALHEAYRRARFGYTRELPRTRTEKAARRPRRNDIGVCAQAIRGERHHIAPESPANHRSGSSGIVRQQARAVFL
ncbi:hypothetical protein P3102_10935 [Amycolatopsis sp. QT-25]|uniref:hypothetical protein n=1 Tax=Amycolatopsis sp. QT-25 TaxID=3034022 RepID=UPI0023ECFA19|nr:hypothetical protein [Amycolatopsis sp. QT-25]WET81678.1 hypothetical protein P3102_10935 [Amycolatopsis sp. QT-25]